MTEAKCNGLANIYAVLCELGVTPSFLIVNSSISSLLGNQGQTNYSAANAFVDEFIRSADKRRSKMISINWGNWLEVISC